MKCSRILDLFVIIKPLTDKPANLYPSAYTEIHIHSRSESSQSRNSATNGDVVNCKMTLAVI